jgi:elongation factor G
MPGYAMTQNPAAPILSLTIVPASAQDFERIESALARLVEESPDFSLSFHRREGSFVIGGHDELVLEAICAQLTRTAEIASAELRIEYRETIRKQAEAEGKYIRQTGGSGNYGHCWLRVEPNAPGAGYEFINEIKGGSVPKEYIKPIDQGIQEAMLGGILAGYEMVDVKVSLYDGSYHDVDSNEMAFKIAGSMAFKEAARKAKPVLLEPVMSVEVTVPEEYMGTIIGDLNSRRGRIEGMEMVGGTQAIKATVPLSTMFGYATHMRSSTQGRANYSMQFKQYEEAPRSVSEEIIAKVQGKEANAK